MKRISQLVVLPLAAGFVHAADLDLLKNSRQLFALGKRVKAADTDTVRAEGQLHEALTRREMSPPHFFIKRRRLRKPFVS